MMTRWQHTETYKTIRLAVPIIIGELAQMSLHLIDTAMVGAISYKHLAAAALVVNAVNIPFVIGMGMTISVSQMVSMANGRRDAPGVSHYLFNGFFVCSLFALLICLGLVAGRSVVFHLGQDPEVARLAYPFLSLVTLSIIPMLLFMTLKQFTDGLEYTRTAMILSLGALPVNTFLNWLFIYGHWGFPRMELRGAGLATLITRILLFLILAIVIAKHGTFHRYRMVSRNQWKLKWKTILELLHIGIPSSLQLGMEVSAFAISGIIIGTMGAITQAAHQIALSCAAFTFMVSMGLSQAGSIRISNAYGRSDWNSIRIIGKTTFLTALIYGGICAGCFILFRWQLPGLFNNNPAVIHLASVLLLFAAVFQMSDSTQAIGAGLLRGIKDVKVPTVLVTIAYWAIGLPVGYLLAFRFNMRSPGIWLGFIAGLTMASILLAIRFWNKVSRKKPDPPVGPA